MTGLTGATFLYKSPRAGAAPVLPQLTYSKDACDLELAVEVGEALNDSPIRASARGVLNRVLESDGPPEALDAARTMLAALDADYSSDPDPSQAQWRAYSAGWGVYSKFCRTWDSSPNKYRKP